MSNDDISDSLGMHPIEDVTPKQEVIPVTEISVEKSKEIDEFERDTQLARQNIISIVTKGENALDEILEHDTK